MPKLRVACPIRDLIDVELDCEVHGPGRTALPGERLYAVLVRLCDVINISNETGLYLSQDSQGS